MSPEKVLRRLQETLAWAGFRIEPEGRRDVEDVYFDTPDHQLRAAGWSYRRRQDAAGQRIALKEMTRARSAVFDRMEVEQVIPGDIDDLSRPPAGAVQTRLSNLLAPGADVAPLFAVSNRRAAYALSHPSHPEGLVGMAFDRVSIGHRDAGNGNGRAPELRFTELELELKEGPHELLASVLAAVELEPALRQARLSKFERGLIAMNCPLERRQPHPPNADRGARWLDVGLVHLKLHLEQLRTYEPYAWEGLHVEGVHQMRIATRRARAALRAFAPALPRPEAERLAERLHWLADRLGAVRDLDVHQAKLARDLGRTGFEDHPSARRYQRHLKHLHIRAHDRLVEALASSEYRALVGDYRALIDAAMAPANASDLRIEDVASQTVLPLLDKVLSKGRALDGAASDRKLHKLRIKTKRLRYKLEFLRPVYGEALDPAIEAARKLQSHLGTNQDARVGRGHLEAFRGSRVTGKHGHKVFKRLIERQHKRARRQRKRFASDWQRMEAAAAHLRGML